MSSILLLSQLLPYLNVAFDILAVISVAFAVVIFATISIDALLLLLFRLLFLQLLQQLLLRLLSLLLLLPQLFLTNWTNQILPESTKRDFPEPVFKKYFAPIQFFSNTFETGVGFVNIQSCGSFRKPWEARVTE